MSDKHVESPEQDTLTIQQLAKRLGISDAKAYEMAQLNEYPFPVIRIGGRVMVSRKAYDAWLDRYNYDPEQDTNFAPKEESNG